MHLLQRAPCLERGVGIAEIRDRSQLLDCPASSLVVLFSVELRLQFVKLSITKELYGYGQFWFRSNVSVQILYRPKGPTIHRENDVARTEAVPVGTRVFVEGWNSESFVSRKNIDSLHLFA